MKNLSTRNLLQKMLRRAWIGLLVGVLFAGGYYVWKTHSAPENIPGQTPAAEETTVPEQSPLLKRFVICTPDFSAYAEQESPTMCMNEYSQSLAAFAANRFRTDNAILRYYQTVLGKYPALDYRIFTSEMVRAMIGAWQYNGDMVLSVSAPSIEASRLDHYAEALGLDETAPDALDQAQCLLRDAVYQAVVAYLEEPAALAESGVSLTRADASYEEELGRQSVVNAEADAGILPDSVAEKNTHPGKKALALLFLLGFVLVEAVVAAFAMLDDTLRSASDLEQNCDLTVLSAGKDTPAALQEAALKLIVRGEAPGSLALAPVGADAEAAKSAAGALTAALKAAAERAGQNALAAGEIAVIDDASVWNESLAAAIGKSVVLLVCRGKTQGRALNAAAEILRGLDVPVAGAILMDP